MKSRSRARKWAIGWAIVVLLAGSSLPIWTIHGRYTPEQRARGSTKPFFREVPLWILLADLPRGVVYDVHYTPQNLIITGLLLVLVGGVGVVVYYVLAPRSEAAGDFAESNEGQFRMDAEFLTRPKAN